MNKNIGFRRNQVVDLGTEIVSVGLRSVIATNFCSNDGSQQFALPASQGRATMHTEHLPGFRAFLEGFSGWMVNRASAERNHDSPEENL